MSEAKTDLNTPLVEGELSLDDLSQIAGGTSSDVFAGPGALKQSDNMFDSFVGAKGTTIFCDTATGAKGPLDLKMSFP